MESPLNHAQQLGLELENAKKRNQHVVSTRRGLAYAVLIIGCLTMPMPFLWMITTSLKHPGEVFSSAVHWWKEFIPCSFVWENYLKVPQMVPFVKFYLNSILVALCVTFGQVATSSMAAYAFARLRFPGRDKIFFGYLGTMMLPGAVTMIPVFILLKNLGWIDTYKAVIVPSLFTAYGTFMLRQFFMTLPRDLEDAAKIDGCSLFGIFWRIILPLSKPALATLTTFTFMGTWQSFMWPLIVLNSHEKFTLPVGLAYFLSVHSTHWTLLMASSVMTILPIIILFILTQRYFVEGIKMTGLKG